MSTYILQTFHKIQKSSTNNLITSWQCSGLILSFLSIRFISRSFDSFAKMYNRISRGFPPSIRDMIENSVQRQFHMLHGYHIKETLNLLLCWFYFKYKIKAMIKCKQKNSENIKCVPFRVQCWKKKYFLKNFVVIVKPFSLSLFYLCNSIVSGCLE